ncbi:MAG: hypothetical protein JWL77_3405 [Chthonomonadaceae bacterium]|nr:hypothetical protein [Chthonomonadaceae bacterium]
MLRNTIRIIFLIWVCSLGVLAHSLPADPPTAAQIEFFETHVRPVLVARCYGCHNSTALAQGGLAVDQRAALLKGGKGGVVLVPGRPDRSRLIAVLEHTLPGLEMPKGGAKLDKNVIADFTRWIAMGAPDPRDKPLASVPAAGSGATWAAKLAVRKKWWCFQPIKNVAPPVVPANRWSDHPIDRFVLAKLTQNHLSPAPPTDPATLVRRVYFALVGVPPTPAEVQVWTARLKTPGGMEALVDHLLASPQFGETWARHWMDWVRYADSHGSEGDPEIVNGWQFRDYLIRALNADVPYDQLVREQVAGDLLPKPRVNTTLGINESAIGPAHWRMVFHGFAPTDALEEKVRFTDDEINTFSKAFLGLTVACARCHDHKFDAISQKDYYALYGVLASCRPGRTVIDLPAKLNRHRDELTALKPRIRSAVAEAWLTAGTGLRTKLLASDGPWKQADRPGALLNPLFTLRTGSGGGAWDRLFASWQGDRQERQKDSQRTFKQRWNLAQASDYSQWFRQGNGLPDKPSSPGEFAPALSGDTVLSDIYPAGVYTDSLSTKYAARMSSTYVRLDGDYELWLRVLGDGGATARYVVQNYPRDGTVSPVNRLSPQWQWQKFDMTYWNGDEMHVELADAEDAPILATGQARSWFGLREAVIVKKGERGPVETQEILDPLFETLGAAASPTVEKLADAYVQTIMAAVKAWRECAMTDAQALLLSQCIAQGLLPNRLSELPSAGPLLATYRRLESEIATPTRVPGLEEGPARNQALYARGNHKTPDAEVPRRFLEAIDPKPYKTAQSGRLELAADLLRDDNPLTRRVIVNRIWHHLFGRGIVPTPDNFGRLGEQPTHRELLDYLATRFKQHGWSIKETIKFIVTSKAWQMQSQPSAQARQIDPDNRLLSHAFVRRLDAEAIRDSLLSVSGTLNVTEFGPPVDGSTPRRSVYVRVQRTALDPLLRAFDFPEPFSAVGRRDVTNVPAQSLTLMNDPGIAAMASAWATRLLADKELPTDDVRIQQMFVSVLGRNATDTELIRITAYLQETLAANQRLAQQAAALQQRREVEQSALRTLTEPIRARLLQAAQGHAPVVSADAPKPIGKWDFLYGLKDAYSGLQTSLHGEAAVGKEGLQIRGESYATLPLENTLKAKTLEAWVELDNLSQRGGGVISIMTPDGSAFDAIVFGEREPGQWMAGSENFRRTQPFEAPPETDATTRPVHIALVYYADGRIVAYREGKLYGKGYQSTGPTEFAAGLAVIGFGIRHLPAGTNKHLAGRILSARLYDRALSPEEVATDYRSSPTAISQADILAALSPADRALAARYEQNVAALEAEINALGPMPQDSETQRAWSELARALFNFKEFLYVN